MPSMSNPSRRDILVGAASTAAGVALPDPAPAAVVTRAVALPLAADQDDLGIFVPGCGEACDCDWYLRSECAWGRMVRKLGDKFIIYDKDNNVISEADPGFRPLPEDAEWIEKVEYARAHGLPHPYDWPKEKHAAWRMGMLEPAPKALELP